MTEMIGIRIDNYLKKCFQHIELSNRCEKREPMQFFQGLKENLISRFICLLKKGEKDNVSHIVRIPRGKNKTSIGRWTVYFDNEPLDYF